jgi:hypothetical protein
VRGRRVRSAEAKCRLESSSFLSVRCRKRAGPAGGDLEGDVSRSIRRRQSGCVFSFVIERSFTHAPARPLVQWATIRCEE